MDYGLYVITDEIAATGRSHAHIAKKCMKNGANVLQIRDSKMTPQELLTSAKEVVELTRGHEMAVIVCDDLDAALGSGANGVHIYQADISVTEARSKAPAGFLIGVSVKDADEAIKAESDGADYVIWGPLFQSYLEDLGELKGLDDLKALKGAVNIPVIAIGGIKLFNVTETLEAGADGVAVKTGALHQRDIGEAVGLLAKTIARQRKVA